METMLQADALVLISSEPEDLTYLLQDQIIAYAQANAAFYNSFVQTPCGGE